MTGWRRLRAIVIKELWAVLRDPRGRITLILPPILQLFLFGYASTLEVKNITLGIYDRDRGAWSQELTERIAGSPNVARVIEIRSPEAMRRAIDSREAIGVVVFDQGFSRDVAAGRPATAQALLDGRRSNASQIVGGYLSMIFASAGAELRTGTAGGGGGGGGTMVVNAFNPNLDFLWFTMPSLIVTIAAISVLSVTAQSVAREKELGTYDQILVSPLRTHELLIGKSVPALLLGLFNATLYIILIPLAFHVPLTGSAWLFYVSLLAFLPAMIGLGLLISTLAQSQQQAFLGMFLATVPLILLSGYASPIDNMPPWLQVVSAADPLRYFLVVCEGLFLKAMPAADVLANTWPMAIIAAVSLWAAAILFRSRLE